MAELIRRLLGRFTNTGKPAKYLIVPLVPSAPVSLEISAQPIDTDRQPSVRLGRWSVGVEWDEEVPVGGAVELVALADRGLPMAIRSKARWFGAEELFDVLVGPDDQRTLEAAMQSYEEELLEAALADDPAPVDGIERSVEYREFFRDYDYDTNPKMFETYLTDPAEVQERCKRMYYVSWLLWKRLKKWRVDRNPPRHDANFVVADEDPVDDEWIKALSERQREIFEAHFLEPPSGNTPATMRWDWVGEAFDLFASGHLKDSEGVFNYAPDSENLFLFAEFARVAGERGFDRPFWAELLHSLTRAQRLFLETYSEPDEADPGKLKLVDPMPSENKLDLAEIAQVRIAYANVGGADLMDKLLENIDAGHAAGMEKVIICPHVGEDV